LKNLFKGKNTMNYLKDEKFGCHSIIENISMYDYMQLIDNAYSDHGGIYGQRTTLTTKSAKQIRERMVEDFKNGAVLPPIVIGIVDPFPSLNNDTSPDEFKSYLESIDKDNISIIDGMQRTTAIKESSLSEDDQKDRLIRVEFWIVQSINDLIYRMLVLNTGQVPWNTRRQLEVVFTPIKKAISEKIPNLNLIEIYDGQRRTEAGHFQADRIIELFHVFSSRSEKFDTKQTLSEAYQRIDMIEGLSKDNVFDIFIEILNEIVRMDINFAKCEEQIEEGRFKRGKDIFASQPALVSFVVVLAQAILGRPGVDYSTEKIEEKRNSVVSALKSFNDILERKNSEEICKFIDLGQLNEIVSNLKGTKVGDIERDYFKSAFKVLIEENFQLESLTPCWRV
jgi:hypothetical protein